MAEKTTLEKIKAELQRQADADYTGGPYLDMDDDRSAVIDGRVDLVALAAAVDADRKAVVEHADGTVSYLTDVDKINGTVRAERLGDVFLSDLPPPFRPWSPKIIRVQEVEGRGLIFVVEADARYEVGRRDLLNRVLTLDGATYAVIGIESATGSVIEKGSQFGVCVQKMTDTPPR